MTKQQVIEQWNEWRSIIAAFLGPLTSLIFEDKYNIRQIISRLLVGGACAIFLGGYLEEHVESERLKALVIYLSGIGGYYIIKGIMKIFEMFGLDPKAGISYVLNIIKNLTKKNENSNQNTGSNTGN